MDEMPSNANSNTNSNTTNINSNSDIYSHSSNLFTKEDGLPLVFLFRPCPEKKRLKPIVKHGGGVMLLNAANTIVEGTIRLALPGDQCPKDSVSVDYIEECVRQNRLLDIDNYRMDGDHSMDDSLSFDEVDSSSDVRRHVARSLKGRNKYRTSDDHHIVDFLMESERYKDAGGNRVWQDMFVLKITGHSAQSMKDRYRRYILPSIDQYNLPPRVISTLKLWTRVKGSSVSNSPSPRSFKIPPNTKTGPVNRTTQRVHSTDDPAEEAKSFSPNKVYSKFFGRRVKIQTQRDSSLISPSRPDKTTTQQDSSLISPSRPDKTTTQQDSSLITPSRPDKTTTQQDSSLISPSRSDKTTTCRQNSKNTEHTDIQVSDDSVSRQKQGNIITERVVCNKSCNSGTNSADSSKDRRKCGAINKVDKSGNREQILTRSQDREAHVLPVNSPEKDDGISMATKLANRSSSSKDDKNSESEVETQRPSSPDTSSDGTGMEDEYDMRLLVEAPEPSGKLNTEKLNSCSSKPPLSHQAINDKVQDKQNMESRSSRKDCASESRLPPQPARDRMLLRSRMAEPAVSEDDKAKRISHRAAKGRASETKRLNKGAHNTDTSNKSHVKYLAEHSVSKQKRMKFHISDSQSSESEEGTISRDETDCKDQMAIGHKILQEMQRHLNFPADIAYDILWNCSGCVKEAYHWVRFGQLEDGSPIWNDRDSQLLKKNETMIEALNMKYGSKNVQRRLLFLNDLSSH